MIAEFAVVQQVENTHDDLNLITTHKPVNNPVLVPVLDVILEDFIVLMGGAGIVFLFSSVLFRLVANLAIPLVLWTLDIIGVLAASYWLKTAYRERGAMGGDAILYDALQYLVRSRRIPGRKIDDIGA